MQYQIFLIEDHPNIREVYKLVIEREADMRISGEAGAGEQALSMLAATTPHLVVLDLRIPGTSGIELIKQIRALHPRLPILVVSGQNNLAYAALVLQIGVNGYLDKFNCLPVLIEAIRQVLSGASYVDDRLRRYLHQQEERQNTLRPGPHQ